MIVDVNVNLSRWPFRRLPCDETSKLVEALQRANVTSAWAGSFDGLLHRDVSAVNQRLVDDCKKFGDGRLIPFGSINPTLPDWQEDLRRCHEVQRMPGIRLHPNYHGYELKAPVFEELIAAAVKRGLIVQLALKMEDERTQHPLMRVPTVDAAPLADIVGRHPQLQLVILNGLRTLNGEQNSKLSAAGNVYFEISMQEGVGGIAKLLESVSHERVLFGSHFPFFYLESALLKLHESNLGGFRTKAISYENANRLLAQSASEQESKPRN